MPQRTTTGTQARQGRLGQPVLAVLAVSLVLIALYVVGLMLWAGTDALRRTTSEPGRPLGGPDSGVSQSTGQSLEQGRSGTAGQSDVPSR